MAHPRDPWFDGAARRWTDRAWLVIGSTVPWVIAPAHALAQEAAAPTLPAEVVQWTRAVAAAFIVGFAAGAFIWARARMNLAKREFKAIARGK